MTYTTKTGKVLTDEDIEKLADEAERGYDAGKIRGSARYLESAMTVDEQDRLASLAETLHTGWRKGTDGPLAMTVHRTINSMDPDDWGDYVCWVDWCLGVVGYKPPEQSG